MLNNATGYKKIYIACGYTDLRQGIDGLAATIRQTLEIDPFQKNVLFMFCGRKPANTDANGFIRKNQQSPLPTAEKYDIIILSPIHPKAGN